MVGVIDHRPPRLKYAGQIDNIIFLDRVGETLRWATDGIPKEQLPEDMRLLLRRLERWETKAMLKPQR